MGFSRFFFVGVFHDYIGRVNAERGFMGYLGFELMGFVGEQRLCGSYEEKKYRKYRNAQNLITISAHSLTMSKFV